MYIFLKYSLFSLIHPFDKVVYQKVIDSSLITSNKEVVCLLWKVINSSLQAIKKLCVFYGWLESVENIR